MKSRSPKKNPGGAAIIQLCPNPGAASRPPDFGGLSKKSGKFPVLSAQRPFPGLRNRAKKAIFRVSP